MKKLILIIFVFVSSIFLFGCSYGYNVLIVNESNSTIEIIYKLKQDDSKEKPLTISLEDWKKGVIFNPDNIIDFEIRKESNERVIKLPAKTVLEIERGHWNPITEEEGRLTNIEEITIKTIDSEISYKGKLLLSQFDKENYTYTKTIKDELTN